MEMIECKICGLYFQTLKGHLRRTHGISFYQYLVDFPGAPVTTSEFEEKKSGALVEAWARMDPEVKEARANAISEALTGMPSTISKEGRCNIREGWWNWWNSLDLDGKRAAMWGGSKHNEVPTGSERMLQKFLEQKYPGLFIPDWVDRLSIGGRYPDFRTRNGYKLIIESFGTRWHDPMFSDRPTEEELVAIYEKEGWDCIVVWANNAEDIIYEWPNLAKQIDNKLKEKTSVLAYPVSIPG